MRHCAYTLVTYGTRLKSKQLLSDMGFENARTEGIFNCITKGRRMAIRGELRKRLFSFWRENAELNGRANWTRH